MKRIILTVLVLLLLVLPMNALAADFSDMPNDWSTEALEKAVENGLLTGYNGKIMPNDNLTRAQMAAVINRSFGAYKEASLATFTDVKASEWYYSDMAKAVNMKTFEGSNNMLNPEDSITREQAFAVMARALKIEPTMEAPTGFVDLDKVSTWAKGEIYAMINAGYIQGSNNMINPQGYVTRAEFAKLMDNMIKEYISLPGQYTVVAKGNVMVNTKDVVLKDIVVEGDLIIGDGVAEGDVTLENVEVMGRMVVRGGGVDSIKIMGTSNIKTIIIARVDGKVRVYSEEGVEIGEVIIDGIDDVILEGEFESVTVLASNTEVLFIDATIKSVVITGEGSKLNVDKDSEIDKVVVNEKNTIIEGKGTVKEVLANANDVKVYTLGTKVTAGPNATGVMAGDIAVDPGENEIVIEEVVTPPSSGGGGGGGDVYTAPVFTSASLNGVALTPATVNSISVPFTSKLDNKYVIVANFDKAVEVKSISIPKLGLENIDIQYLEGKIGDFTIGVKSTQLTFTIDKLITNEHFDTFGNVVIVTVTDGTTDLPITITIIE